MKTSFSIFLCGLAGVLATAAAHAQTGAGSVRIEVRVLSEQDRKDLKGTQVDSVTQKKTLAITLTGAAKAPETRTAKWSVFGRNLKSDIAVLIGSGEFKIDLSQSGVQHAESKQVWTTSTREHATVATKAGGNNAVRQKVTKVGATGTKYIGYGVQVRDGGTVVAEVFDPPSLKQDVH